MTLQDDLAARIVIPIVVAAVLLGALLGSFVVAGSGKAPSQSSAADLAMSDLSSARAAERRDLARAATPQAQQAAAEQLRRAHLQAAAQVGPTDASLAAALRTAAAAYGDLARAARSDDHAAFVRATKTVAGADRRLEAALQS